MNKQQLIKAMAVEASMTQTATAIALEAFQATVAQALADGKDVTLVNFGTFKTTERATYVGKNPKTGDPVNVPAKTRVGFVAGKGLKDAVN